MARNKRKNDKNMTGADPKALVAQQKIDPASKSTDGVLPQSNINGYFKESPG